MSQHSNDAFDQHLKNELLEHQLRESCAGDRQCSWFRNEEGMLECKHCGREVDE